MLKFSPIQIQQAILTKKPKGLIYKHRDGVLHTLMDTSTGNYVGKMSIILRPCNNLSFYNNLQDVSTLHVYSLKIEEKNKGWGSYFIDYAKQESYRRGCNGRCSLVAHHSGRSPHLFYKKKGFVTTNEAYNNYLDECIRTGKPLYYEKAVNMFIPVKEPVEQASFVQNPVQEQKGIWNSLFDKLRQLFV